MFSFAKPRTSQAVPTINSVFPFPSAWNSLSQVHTLPSLWVSSNSERTSLPSLPTMTPHLSLCPLPTLRSFPPLTTTRHMLYLPPSTCSQQLSCRTAASQGVNRMAVRREKEACRRGRGKGRRECCHRAEGEEQQKLGEEEGWKPDYRVWKFKYGDVFRSKPSNGDYDVQNPHYENETEKS